MQCFVSAGITKLIAVPGLVSLLNPDYNIEVVEKKYLNTIYVVGLEAPFSAYHTDKILFDSFKLNLEYLA